MKKIRVLLIIICSIALSLFLLKVCGRKTVLQGIDFSDAYLDRNGELLKVYLTKDEKYRIFSPLSNFTNEFISAVLEQEDKRFYQHNGINFPSLVRAFTETYIKKTRTIGGSTITMQTAKLLYKINTKNIFGKLSQIFLALYLEYKFSKNEILEAYLNLVSCGRNIEGFYAGGIYFFGKEISALTMDQIIMLCVLPQNPQKRCPSKNCFPDDLLNAMNRLGESLNCPNYIAPEIKCFFPENAKHFTRFLHLNSTEKSITQKKVSIDLSLQNILEKNIHGTKENNCAAILLNAKSMEIEAYVGSKDFWNKEISGQVDGIISRRSPGSALKPFVYALAMDQGVIHSDSLLADTPTSFGNYSPDNYEGNFKGPISARDALLNSQNIPAVYLESIINPDVYDFLNFGEIKNLKDKNFYGVSIALGTVEISPLEMASLYAMILNDGTKRKIKYFPNEKTVDENKSFLSKESCFITKKILEENTPPIERKSLANKVPLGFKTGTSYRFRDAWTVGFFADYVLCVWIGNFNGKDGYFIGRQNAAPLFTEIADEIILEKKLMNKINSEKVLEDVSIIDVCSISGAIPNENCLSTKKAYFIPGVSPINKCSVHRMISENGKNYVAEFWRSDFLELFEKAGLPRTNAKIDRQYRTNPPQIQSPLADTEYFVDKNNRDSIILQADADYGVENLFWFIDNQLIAKTKPNEKYQWKAECGKYTLTVVDSNGMGNSRALVVYEKN